MHHAVTSAEVLRDGGYFTAMTGKWHLDQQFSVQTDRQWHEQTISLQTPKQLSKLRLDVSEGEGTATINDFRLTAADGTVLLRWPNSR